MQSRQASALAWKAIAYQKRQTFTNIFCIALCPMFMVAIAALLGNLINNLIQKSNPLQEYLYCSNLPAMDSNNIPYLDGTNSSLPSTPGSQVPHSTTDNVRHVNYQFVSGVTKTNGPPGSALLQFQRPCSVWYGEDYPNSKLYERPSNASGVLVRDASYLPQPLNGWLSQIIGKDVDPTILSFFLINQRRSWSVFGAEASVNLTDLGQREQKQIPLSFVLSPNSTFEPSFKPGNVSQGLFDTMANRYYVDINKNGINLTQVPWFEFRQGGNEALDNYISSSIEDALARISELDKSAFLELPVDYAKVNRLNQQINELLKSVPHGAVYYRKIDHANRKYQWDYQFGSDKRLAGSTSFPLPGPRLLVQQTQLSNAILRKSNSSLNDYRITQGFRLMPQVKTNALNIPFGGIIGNILYPFGVSFLLPIFVIILVQEKENRILVMMKMNGMSSWAYYLSHYITFYILYLVSTAVFLITGYYSKLTFFTLTETLVLVVLFFVWGHVQIALAFFISTLFNRARLALVTSFLIVLCSVIISLAIARIFKDETAPIAFFIWPPFAFYRTLQLVNSASYEPYLRPYNLSSLTLNDEVLICLIFLTAEIFFFLLLAYYFDCVFPSEFGVKKAWHFPFTDPIKYLRKRGRANKNGGIDPLSEAELAMQVKIDDAETSLEDNDVKVEREKVSTHNLDSKSYPIIMKNMRKVYKGRGGAGPKLAVKDVTLAIEANSIFGLLGPNGAGKTTLISILTGLYEASTGKATIDGYDVQTETSQVYHRIGICPQFDILWDELTVGEHLYFYARLKGIPKNNLRKAVVKALRDVSLEAFENQLTKGLSGGEKRRLSISIALLGDPAVVFLDEPTTGLDPEVRRLIWDIINDARERTTIILTTHSMEEAEALCQRIGIMAKGTLRCLAEPLRLKQLYGSGFKIFINSLAEHTATACNFVESILPPGWTKIDSFATNTSYEFPSVPGYLPKLFEQVESNKKTVGIQDWGVGQTTLEEVFIKLISESDASAD